MKIIQYLVFSFLIFTLTSCPQDDEPPQPVDTPGQLVAKVDGVTKDYLVDARADLGTASFGDLILDSIIISGTTQDGVHYLNILLASFTGEGIYNLRGSSDEGEERSYVYYELTPGGSGQLFPYGTTNEYTGVLNVNSYDGTNIRGTFSATLWDGDDNFLELTNGTFDLKVSQ